MSLLEEAAVREAVDAVRHALKGEDPVSLKDALVAIGEGTGGDQVTPNKKNPEPLDAYARGLQAQTWVVQPEDAHEPAPESQGAESLWPDITAGRLGDKSKYRPAVR